MSNSRIEQIIEEIEDYIDSCKGPLFGGGDKIVVDRERMEELLRKQRLLLHRQIFRIRSWSMSMRSCSRHMSRLIR